MKFRFYIDLWKNSPAYQLKHGLTAMTEPFEKSEGAKRIAFDVTIPDHMLYDTDAVAPEVSRAEVVSG